MIDIIILLIVVVFILVIVMKSGKETSQKASSKENPQKAPRQADSQEPTSQEPSPKEPSPKEPTSHQADSQTPSPKEQTSQEPTSQEPTSQEPSPRQADSQTPSPKEPTSLQPNPQGPSPKEPTSQAPSQAPSQEPSTLIPIDQIIRKFNKSSFGYRTNPINNNGETLSNLVSQYLHNKNKPRKLLLPIGSIIFTLIPLRKNEIGTFQQSGYLLQPITNVQNGVASGVNNIAGKNVNLQTPKIVNRTIRGSKDNKISINEIQYGDNQPQQFISGIPYHIHSLDLPNQRQINMKVVHNSGAFRPGGQPFKYFLKGINKQQNMMKDGEDVVIDVRDKSNVFFFYMVVGYSSEDMGLGEPEDEDGDELF